MEEAEDLNGTVRSLDINAVRNFIARGADVNAKGKYATPLFTLAGMDVKEPDIPRHLEVFNLLIANGADVLSAEGMEKGVALHRAAYSGNCHLIAPLLKKGTPIDISDKDGTTPLASNVRRQFRNVSDEQRQRIEKCAAELIEKGANLTATNVHGRTIIRSAIANGRADIVRLLLGKGVKTDERDENSQTLLMTAAANLRADMVRMLVDHGADIDAQDKEGNTALMLGVSVDQTNRSLHNNGSPAEVTRLLLERGAAVNIKNNKGYTALLDAIRRGYKDAAILLLDHKADPNIKLERGVTALTLSMSDAEMVRKLLDHGADTGRGPDRPNHEKPLWWAVSGSHFDTVRLLIGLGHDKNPDGTKNTDYAMLAATKNASMMGLFLDTGTDSNTTDKKGNTLLIAASGPSRENAAPIVWLLLSQGAQIDRQNAGGSTALMRAAENGNSDIVRTLLQHGANTTLRNHQEETALDVARKQLQQLENSRKAADPSKKWEIERRRETVSLLDGSTPVNKTDATTEKSQAYAPHDKIRKATEGRPHMRAELGRLYFYGLDYVLQDDGEAYYWLSICNNELGDAAEDALKNFYRTALTIEDRALAGEKQDFAAHSGLLVDPTVKEMCRIFLTTLSKRMTDAQRKKVQPRIDAWFAAHPLPKPDVQREEATRRAARLARAADAAVYDLEGLAAIIAAGADLRLNGVQIAADAQKNNREDIAQLVSGLMEGKKPSDLLKNIPPPPKSVNTHTREMAKADEQAADNALIAKSLRAAVDLRHGSPGQRSRAINVVIAAPEGYLPSTLQALSEALFAKFRDDAAVFWHLAADMRAKQSRDICPDIRPEFSLGKSDVPLFEYYKHMQPEKFAALSQKVVEWDLKTPHEYDPQFGRRTSDCAEAAQIPAIRERAHKVFTRENQPNAHIPPNMREMPQVDDLLVKAEAGDADAQHTLHECYGHRRCQMPNEDLQRAYDHRAEQERRQAHQSNITFVGYKPDEGYAEKSLYWLTKAAAQNHPRARASLVRLYMQGSAVQPKDLKKACALMLDMQAEGIPQVYSLIPFAPWNPRSSSHDIEVAAWYAIQHAAAGDKRPYDWSRYQLRPANLEEAERRVMEYTDLYLHQKKPICAPETVEP